MRWGRCSGGPCRTRLWWVRRGWGSNPVVVAWRRRWALAVWPAVAVETGGGTPAAAAVGMSRRFRRTFRAPVRAALVGCFSGAGRVGDCRVWGAGPVVARLLLERGLGPRATVVRWRPAWEGGWPASVLVTRVRRSEPADAEPGPSAVRLGDRWALRFWRCGMDGRPGCFGVRRARGAPPHALAGSTPSPAGA